METKIKRTYWSNGQLQSEWPCVDGIPHGLTKWWWSNGQLGSAVPYVDGMPHGMIKWWHRDGDIDGFWLWNQGEVVAVFYPQNQTQRWKLK
jgi:antitoxin component YwqK of YwqJK toxin-antitoxin module